MNFFKFIPLIALAILSLLITALIGLVVPPKQFVPFSLTLDSTWAKDDASQEYMIDLNNDSIPEFVRHYQINKAGHSLEFKNESDFRIINIFDKKEFFISRYLKFADINQDGLKEIIFLTAKGKTAFLNIIEYRLDSLMFLHLKGVKKIKVDSVNFTNDKPDAINNSLIIHKNNIWFNLQAGYSIQPRNIYKYNFEIDELIKTPRNSMVINEFDIMTWQDHDYLLAKSVVAAGNTVSPEESEMLKSSKDPDTLGYYEYTKDKVYSYGDFGSYILLYDQNIHFVFDPIEFNGWTNFTKAEFIHLGGKPNIVSITNTLKGDSSDKVITICSFDGVVVKQIPMTDDYRNVFTNNSTIVFGGANALHLINDSLEFIKNIPDISYSSGFIDVDGDQEQEFIAFRNNELLVFGTDFTEIASYKINQEFAPYPEYNKIIVLDNSPAKTLFFNTRLFYYQFSYSKNPVAFLKYPFYILLFLFSFGILFFILRLNSRRLEKEKRHLAEIVSERTADLKVKNDELVLKNEEIQIQSEEIQMQADEILQQYERLEKLDQFKETLTHALVHDLKNPLSQILLSNSSEALKHPAKKMLRLITNMLDVEKYEHTHFNLNKEVHSLIELIEEVKSGQEIYMRDKNLKMNLFFHNQHDFLILADKDIIARVFDNLLANAIRFSPQNSAIEFIAEKADDDLINISIKNHGVPIPEDSLPHIFDKYWHSEKTDSSSHRSTGLGLTFCKMAIEAHGYKIVAQNVENGVKFTFSLQGTTAVSISHEPQNDNQEIVLTAEEKTLLKPFFDRLKNLDVNQVSDILQVLAEIPEPSANLDAIKQQILDAAFASNAQLYRKFIEII